MACSDDDSFSVSTGLKIDFPTDTVKLDTVFSHTASSTYSFWVHNRHDKGLRIQNVRLKRGKQSGFRVNVDGAYLDNANGSQISDIEIRQKDSILVFVEVTPSETHHDGPVSITDQLVFSLESGVEQSVCLQAWAWDAIKCYSPVIARDSIIETGKPLLVYGDFTVKEGVQLTIRNTTLYFHSDAGMVVHGTLHTDNCVMRGDRLDRMFSYLPYDRVPGQWKGVRFTASSRYNDLKTTTIRNAIQGVVCDSAAVDSVDYRLKMQQCVVHNCQGDGVKLSHAHVRLEDCQLSNAQGDCLFIDGGMVDISYCTLAQFYPFTGGRGAALHFSNIMSPLYRLNCEGSIITGYDDDVLLGEQAQSSHPFNYYFEHNLLRTPEIDGDQHFNNIIWENSKSEVQGKQHFVKVDEDNLDYDFRLDALSSAVGLGCYR